jgi:phage FluMu protein Com
MVEILIIIVVIQFSIITCLIFRRSRDVDEPGRGPSGQWNVECAVCTNKWRARDHGQGLRDIKCPKCGHFAGCEPEEDTWN